MNPNVQLQWCHKLKCRELKELIVHIATVIYITKNAVSGAIHKTHILTLSNWEETWCNDYLLLFKPLDWSLDTFHNLMQLLLQETVPHIVNIGHCDLRIICWIPLVRFS